MIDNKIDHFAFVLDASSSMTRHRMTVIKVIDAEIARLKRRSEELDRQMRVSVYTFADHVKNVIFDMDVYRLPSIAGFYDPYGNTALNAAVLKADEDLAQTAQMYGDHAFMTIVATDGQDNRSRGQAERVRAMFATQKDNQSTIVLVPNADGVYEAVGMGYHPGNVAVWDATSTEGVLKVGSQMTHATESFITARTSGVRSVRNVFSTGADAVNADTVKSLAPLAGDKYRLIPVGPVKKVIRPFIADECGIAYRIGQAFYQLSKTEEIQPQKQIIVVEKATDKAFTGQAARDLLGLPAMHVTVKPDFNPAYDIYVQSTSTNRNLMPGTKVLVLL